jgi:hypothetical protein
MSKEIDLMKTLVESLKQDEPTREDPIGGLIDRLQRASGVLPEGAPADVSGVEAVKLTEHAKIETRLELRMRCLEAAIASRHETESDEFTQYRAEDFYAWVCERPSTADHSPD